MLNLRQLSLWSSILKSHEHARNLRQFQASLVCCDRYSVSVSMNPGHDLLLSTAFSIDIQRDIAAAVPTF